MSRPLHHYRPYFRKVACCFGAFLFAFIPFKTFPLNTFVKLRLFSQYPTTYGSFDAPLSKVRILKKGRLLEETVWPLGVPIEVFAEKNRVRVKIGLTQRLIEELEIDPPRGAFLTLKTTGDLSRKVSAKVSVRSEKGNLMFIETLGLEEYTQEILEGLFPYNYPTQALKAQAVLIRSFALGNRRHLKEGFDLCDSKHCLRDPGKEKNYRSHEQAVKSTRGMILADQFVPIQSGWQESCPKTTESKSAESGPKKEAQKTFCLNQAKEMAKAGKTFEEILFYYFSDAQLIER